MGNGVTRPPVYAVRRQIERGGNLDPDAINILSRRGGVDTANLELESILRIHRMGHGICLSLSNPPTSQRMDSWTPRVFAACWCQRGIGNDNIIVKVEAKLAALAGEDVSSHLGE